MSSYKTRKTPGDTEWFTKDRFGMFIHFGLYALPARNEWIKRIETMSDEEYQKYFDHFNPDMLDTREWARQAKEAGMKYVVLTTKHHDGFCLFDTKFTDYKATNTPYGKDIIREYVDAFRAEGLKVGFYYSLLDWHHPEFTIDSNHPMINVENSSEINNSRDMKKYAEYMRNQVTELLTNYGKIDILWLDFSYPSDELQPKPWMHGKGADDWEAEKLINTVRSLQPNIIINNRTDIEQDLWTPEQFQPEEWVRHEKTGELVVWESCHTMCSSWGYFRDETVVKPPKMLIELLINNVCAGGNLIMNVGPTGRGYLSQRDSDALKVYADWMKVNSRSIYNCTMAEPEFTAPRGCRLTQSTDGKKLYIHLLEYPVKFLIMKNFADKIEYAQFLHDASEIRYTLAKGEREAWDNGTVIADSGSVIFNIPDNRPNQAVPVIEVFLK